MKPEKPKEFEEPIEQDFNEIWGERFSDEQKSVLNEVSFELGGRLS